MIRIIVLMLIMIPSSLFAFTPINTGYDLYHNLKFADDPQDTEDILNSAYALGYLKGSVDGIIFMQDVYYDRLFPPKMMTEKERKEFSKEFNFVRLNMPKTGIASGQMVLIYKKFAEKYPEELSSSARVSILKSLINAYGWK
jgi:hypothetical protein